MKSCTPCCISTGSLLFAIIQNEKGLIFVLVLWKLLTTLADKKVKKETLNHLVSYANKNNIGTCVLFPLHGVA